MPPPEPAGLIPIHSRQLVDAAPGGLCGQPAALVTGDGMVADRLVADGVTGWMLDAIGTGLAYDRAALRAGIAAISR